jgi:phospholipid N-methyltransferase
MASFSPSSQQLARQMVAQVPTGARRIIELGAGTGVFTKALLDSGIAPDDLLVVELNHELHELLRQRFKSSHIIRGDACDLTTIVQDNGFGDEHTIDAVISGLGFLAMPRATQKSILEAVFRVLAPDRPLVQFTYGPVNPLPRDLLVELDLTVRRASMAWLNVPPATVYVYTRNRSTQMHATRTI